MKIAIHHRKGSFSERWIDYCKEIGVEYKLVDAFKEDIIDQVKDCDIFMWHFHHAIFKDNILAKELLASLEHSGMTVYPDFRTVWHFDDKVSQKYLLEAVDAPLVPSYVFYSKEEALRWAKTTSYPKVFKLSKGAGSTNVKLAKTKGEAVSLINQAFGSGFKPYDRISRFKDRIKSDRSIVNVGKATFRLIRPEESAKEFNKKQPLERDYVYFQDFIENDGFDIRVVVIDNKAVALKRLVRDNDFRASGSGKLIFENENIDKRYIEEAFKLNEKIQATSLAIDFIHSKNDNIYVVEISYGFPMINFLDGASGFWDSELNWHEEDFNLQAWMVDSLLKKHNLKKAKS